jgi:tetratricopeptide (TPR) repeat protein
MILSRARIMAIAFAMALILGVFQLSNEEALAQRGVSGTPLAWFAQQPFAGMLSAAGAEARERYFPTVTEHRFAVVLALEAAQKNPSAENIRIAQACLARLPQDREYYALEAQILALQHQIEPALAMAIHARASATVELELNVLDSEGRWPVAAAWNRTWLAHLDDHGIDREAYAQALWRAARYENLAAVATRSASHKRLHTLVALAFLRRELRLTPLSGQALLTAGYGALQLGLTVEARRDFQAAVDADPASASGYVGVARVALAEREMTIALHNAERAAALAPKQPDVMALTRDLEYL